MNNNLDNLIHEKNIPEQLKEYFKNSNRGKKFIDEKMLEEIEELYIYYSALYFFDETEFSAFTISTLERGSEHSAYYYYLKKILDNNIELLSKAKNETYINGKSIDVEGLFKEISTDYNKYLKYFYEKKYEEIKFYTMYSLLGKLDLISELTQEKSYINIYEVGKDELATRMKDLKIKFYIDEN